jgi:hypothetical protein
MPTSGATGRADVARVNVWMPDELLAKMRAELPGVNVSKVLQDGMRALIGCRHPGLVCAECAQALDLAAIVDEAKSAFYSQLRWELEDLVLNGGTAEGAARVAKGVAMAHQISAAALPLPRPGRTQRRRQRDRAWLEQQEVS